MSLSDVFRVGKIKSALLEANVELAAMRSAASSQEAVIASLEGERAELKTALAECGALELQEIKNRIAALLRAKSTLAMELKALDELRVAKSADVIVLDDVLLLQEVGFYKLKYDLESSELYKERLDEIQEKQASMVKAGSATYANQQWKVNNSEKEGEKMTRDYLKLILRSFNNECDASITRVKFSNIESTEKKLMKAFEVLNRLGKQMEMGITRDYLGNL